MPQYIGYSPWQEAASVGRGLGATLTDILINLPRLRQQAEVSRAQQDYYAANAERERAAIPLDRAKILTEMAQRGLYDTQAEYHRARTGEVDQVMKAKTLLGDALSQIPAAIKVGADITPHITVAVDNLAKLPHSDRSSLAETLAQMIEMDKPRYRQALGLGQSMLQPVSAEGSLYNAITGEMEAQRGIKLGYGQRYVSPESGEVLAQGDQRPLAAQNLDGVYSAAARGFFDPNTSPKEKAAIMESLPEFLGSLPGQGMPEEAPPIVPGRGKGIPKARKNPQTGKWEIVK